MPTKKSSRGRKRMSGRKSMFAKRSPLMRRTMKVIESARRTGTAGVAVTFLILVFVVAAAMAIAPRERSLLAGRELRADEPLSPMADPRRVPDARSVAEAAAAAETAQPAPIVTITGCLERNDQTFRLKDTAGEDAPKSRSWKSGFLKKSPAAIHVIDGSNRTKLPDFVGQRVTITGPLVDREMKVRTVQRVAASCTKA